ncbi:hypothetical protein [Paraburkholderia terricola]|uniref:Uncharacterized protein n=1 Tax=Paraburkholderia terricola TaxID=169427 RepID=A0ABU1LZH8_9BURK|nr:hypothetical protein [Paraburkholderia terricola]MDR6412097.1 hypothetical protein [Paraburkholderia terricola]MDR6484198.1 hypothetical protein [Paraburkholderia terricola]
MTNHRAARALPMREGKRAFQRFLLAIAAACKPLQPRANTFPGESSDAGQRRIMVSAPLSLLPTHAQRIAKCGSARM